MERCTHFTFNIQNGHKELPQAMREAEVACLEHNVSQEQIFLVNLCIEELATNALNYGAQGKDGLSIDVAICFGNDGITLILSDDGNPFNPLTEAPTPDLCAPLEERQIGGLGIHLLKNLTKHIAYEYRNAKNTVTISL